MSPVPIRGGLSHFIAPLNTCTCKKKTLSLLDAISYAIPVLLNALHYCWILYTLYDKVLGICDTLQVFKASSPGLKSYSQVKPLLAFFGKGIPRMLLTKVINMWMQILRWHIPLNPKGETDIYWRSHNQSDVDVKLRHNRTQIGSVGILFTLAREKGVWDVRESSETGPIAWKSSVIEN